MTRILCLDAIFDVTHSCKMSQHGCLDEPQLQTFISLVNIVVSLLPHNTHIIFCNQRLVKVVVLGKEYATLLARHLFLPVVNLD